MFKKNILNKNKSYLLKKTIVFFSTIFIVFMLGFGFSFASLENTFDNGANISMRMVPSSPEANSVVKVLLSSFSLNLDTSETTIKINGKVIKNNAYSVREFEFKTGANGKEIIIEIESVDSNGMVYKVVKKIIPESVDLLYESYDSYIPPFYEGGGDILSDSKVRIVAMPEIYDKNGKKIATSDLIYKWSEKGTVDIKKSGYGKNVYYIDRIKAAPIKTIVAVDVVTKDGLISAHRRIIINSKEAKPYIYLQNSPEDFSLRTPIVGGNIEVENNNIFLRSVPYFMNDIGDRELVKDSWFINGKEQKEHEGDSIISIVNNSSNGQFLSLTFVKVISNKYRPLQYARETVIVEFEKVQREYYNNVDSNIKNNSDPIGDLLFK